MGRPIKATFFGNLNRPYYGSEQLGSGVGGEGFATVAVATTGTLYLTSTSYTWTSSAPQIKGGSAASGTLTIAANRGVSSFNVVNPGSGFTSTGSVTVTVSPATTGSAATYAITLTSTSSNAISFTSFLTTASNARTAGDIIKQESSKRYLVQNQDGRGIVKLVATDSLAAGQMNIVATDGAGSTYYVTKLTAHKARVVNRTSTSTALVTSGTATKWTLGAATGTVVTIANA